MTDYIDAVNLQSSLHHLSNSILAIAIAKVMQHKQKHAKSMKIQYDLKKYLMHRDEQNIYHAEM